MLPYALIAAALCAVFYALRTRDRHGWAVVALCSVVWAMRTIRRLDALRALDWPLPWLVWAAAGAVQVAALPVAAAMVLTRLRPRWVMLAGAAAVALSWVALALYGEAFPIHRLDLAGTAVTAVCAIAWARNGRPKTPPTLLMLGLFAADLVLAALTVRDFNDGFGWLVRGQVYGAMLALGAVDHLVRGALWKRQR